jgi:predicted nucleotidyltransferase
MDRAVEIVPGLDPDVLRRIVARIDELESLAIAVLVSGSYARGAARRRSDLDLTVVVRGSPSSARHTWFEDRAKAPPLHVSTSAYSLESFRQRRSAPWEWAFGLAVRDEMRYVWATDETRAALGDPPSSLHPGEPPDLEAFIELVAKVERCAAERDGAGIRLVAPGAAYLAPGLLRPLNDEVVVRDRREALDAALAFRVAPSHYREDLVVALGLVEASDEAVVEATLRLSRELLALLRERLPDVDPRPDLAGPLADGTIERHLGFRDA